GCRARCRRRASGRSRGGPAGSPGPCTRARRIASRRARRSGLDAGAVAPTRPSRGAEAARGPPTVARFAPLHAAAGPRTAGASPGNRAMTPAPMPRQARPDVRTGRLRAADPFELIRWLARSQTDPRKALAELVQNSLDAQARAVTITRVRERGVATLRVLDDGEGVIPELARSEALAYVATHIGHSRKRNPP